MGSLLRTWSCIPRRQFLIPFLPGEIASTADRIAAAVILPTSRWRVTSRSLRTLFIERNSNPKFTHSALKSVLDSFQIDMGKLSEPTRPIRFALCDVKISLRVFANAAASFATGINSRNQVIHAYEFMGSPWRIASVTMTGGISSFFETTIAALPKGMKLERKTKSP